MIKKITAGIVLGIAVAAVLWHRTTYADTHTVNALCPSIHHIKKNPIKGNWVANTTEGLWKSYDMSFATNLVKFVGAQWAGENVGQITCIYNSQQQFMMQGQPTIQETLPVLLVFHTLALQPTQGKWQHIKRGVYNCYASAQSQCPFVINTKPPTGNIIEEAESLKAKAENTQQLPTTGY
jgi:hypothetical protein